MLLGRLKAIGISASARDLHECLLKRPRGVQWLARECILCFLRENDVHGCSPSNFGENKQRTILARSPAARDWWRSPLSPCPLNVRFTIAWPCAVNTLASW